MQCMAPEVSEPSLMLAIERTAVCGRIVHCSGSRHLVLASECCWHAMRVQSPPFWALYMGSAAVIDQPERANKAVAKQIVELAQLNRLC